MLKGDNHNVEITNESMIDWMINAEPHLVKKIYDHFFEGDIDLSFDSSENIERLNAISEKILNNREETYANLNHYEKLILFIMNNGFGWIVYESIDSTIQIIAKIFKEDYIKLRKAVDSLFNKFLIFKFERLKRYNLLFSPPFFLKSIGDQLKEETFFSQDSDLDIEDLQQNLSPYQYIGLISGLISYVITYSPRSSETNEIHKIDFTKMTEFFKDFAPTEIVEKTIKKLSRFGFFEKLNNRIVVNKNILDKILELPINEQLSILFLYDFMDKFDFKKSYFMTLKILARQEKVISLRELFFYYLNNELYQFLKNDVKNLKFLLQQEELKFSFFLKALEKDNIIVIKRTIPGKISIATDSIVINDPHCSLLNSVSFNDRFQEDKFIIEQNYEIIVEPYLKPEILFNLALIAEPVTFQTISIFRITQESIYRSFAYGVTKESLMNFLLKHSKHEVPENIILGIESFIKSLEINKLDDYTIIQANSQESFHIKENFKNKVIEIEPHTFLVFDKNILEQIENFTNENKIHLKYIENFLDGENYFYKIHESNLMHNIKHLHTMKEFFDYYGSFLEGTKVKIDNEI